MSNHHEQRLKLGVVLGVAVCGLMGCGTEDVAEKGRPSAETMRVNGGLIVTKKLKKGTVHKALRGADRAHTSGRRASGP